MKNRKWTGNIPLKIMSVFVGILVWLIVVNVDNPIKSKTIVIPGENVEVINKAYVDSDNKMVMQNSDPDPVRVTVTADRKILSRLTSADISVTADLQQAGNLDTKPVMVPMTASCSGISAENIRISPQYMEVTLEEKATQDFVISATYGETKPAKGYEVGSQTTSPEKVRITGPKSLINKIDRVSAYCSVNNKNKDETMEVSLQVIDKNQDVLTEGKMAYLTIDNPKVLVTTRFWKIRSEVKIKANYVGEPAAGYQVDSVKTVPDTISLAGTDEALENLRLEENILWIAGENTDISGATGDVETKVSLSDVIPENTKLISGTSEDVWVNVVVLPEGSRSFTIPANEVAVENAPGDLQYAFDMDKIEVRIKGDERDIEKLGTADIRASVDLKDKTEGSYEIPVTIKLPKGYQLLREVTAAVTISAITSPEENKG
ncbi:MAG: CdaR family protein [Eubacteriales bacterium]|nr:CdaR family protein [Eubacteriales bacterium]